MWSATFIACLILCSTTISGTKENTQHEHEDDYTCGGDGSRSGMLIIKSLLKGLINMIWPDAGQFLRSLLDSSKIWTMMAPEWMRNVLDVVIGALKIIVDNFFDDEPVSEPERYTITEEKKVEKPNVAEEAMAFMYKDEFKKMMADSIVEGIINKPSKNEQDSGTCSTGNDECKNA